jgi:hypothetical protein
MNKTYRIAIGVGSLAAGVGLLTGCSGTSAPQALANLSTSHGAVRAATLGDDPNGCYQRGTPEDGNAGWNCNYVGGAATITVPAGVTGMTLQLSGGQGGTADPASGGYGAALTGTFPVSAGQTLTVNLGGGASDNKPGVGAVAAADGGGAGCTDGGAGGAASSVELNGTTVAVASGGGGGGAQGFAPDVDAGGAGGTSATNSGKGSGGSGPASGGGGKGGAGGSALTPGGSGHDGSWTGGCSGGGGGGWSGGIGGGAGHFGGGGGGGGGAGGDYFSSSATNTSVVPANAGGDGMASITWIG